MSITRSGLSWKSAVTAMLLLGLGMQAGWADGFTNIDNTGYQQFYNSDVGAIPQRFPRIDPDTQPYQVQIKPRPAQTLQGRATNPKPLSTKIADGFTDLWKSPGVRGGVAGAGIGLGTAALTKHMGLWHGTWVGAAYGAGFGLMDEISFFKKHPMVRRTAKGAVVGLGAAAVSGAAALGPAAAVGAGVGAGIHLLKLH